MSLCRMLDCTSCVCVRVCVVCVCVVCVCVCVCHGVATKVLADPPSPSAFMQDEGDESRNEKKPERQASRHSRGV